MDEPVVIIKRWTGPVTTSQTMNWNYCRKHGGWHLEPTCEPTPEEREVGAMVEEIIERHSAVFERLS